MRGAAFALLLLLLAELPLFAQTTSSQGQSSSPAPPATPPSTGSSTGSTAAGGQAAQPSGPQPVPYSPDEFPAWLRELYRGEVIAVGSFPITLLFSSLTYQLARYAQHGFSSAYAPALLGASATPLTSQERIGVILGAAGLAVVVSLIDFALGRVQKKK